ncbi:MAG: hypothetical protein U0414_09825 [Polyangiaceae bacterium]
MFARAVRADREVPRFGRAPRGVLRAREISVRDADRDAVALEGVRALPRALPRGAEGRLDALDRAP